MIDLSTDVLEELETRLIPILEHRGIQVESIQPIGILGRGASSTVFSLLINHKYYVLKLYYSHTSYLKEMRNRKRLIWPPRVLLASRQNENSLGYDLVITEVPKGVSFNSTHLLDWVQERLGQHLLELHRLKRRRKVSTDTLRRSIADVEFGAIRAAEDYGEGYVQTVKRVIAEMRDYLNDHAAVLRVKPSLLHNDLWWDNIIIAKDDVYLVDWESMRAGDYLEDIAFMRVMIDFAPNYDQNRKFWRTARDEAALNRFFVGMLEFYRAEFEGEAIDERLRFYLALQTLRRLSDIFSGRFSSNRERTGIWLSQLAGFWERGLEPPDQALYNSR